MHELIGWPDSIENEIHMRARIRQPNGRVWMLNHLANNIEIALNEISPERDRKIITVVAQKEIVHKAVDGLARFSRQRA